METSKIGHAKLLILRHVEVEEYTNVFYEAKY